MALVLQMSQPAVSRRLRGQIPFRVNELGAIATLLDIPLGRFFADMPQSGSVIPNGSAA